MRASQASHGDAHDKAEERYRDADEHNQAVVRPMQPPSHRDEQVVEQIDADEEQQPPMIDIGRSSRIPLPKNRDKVSTTATTTPIHGVSAPSIRHGRVRTNAWHPGPLPPVPAHMPARPVTRNSRLRSTSTPVATSMPFTYTSRQRSVTSVTVRSVGTCPATTRQSTAPRSPGPKAGHPPLPGSPT